MNGHELERYIKKHKDAGKESVNHHLYVSRKAWTSAISAREEVESVCKKIAVNILSQVHPVDGSQEYGQQPRIGEIHRLYRLKREESLAQLADTTATRVKTDKLLEHRSIDLAHSVDDLQHAENATQAILRENPNYESTSKHLHILSGPAGYLASARSRLEAIESAIDSSIDQIENNKLFKALKDKGYGTSEYSGSAFIRLWDNYFARKYRYQDRSAKVAQLLSSKNWLYSHIKRLKMKIESLDAQLQSMTLKARAQTPWAAIEKECSNIENGIDQLRAQNATLRRTEEQLSTELHDIGLEGGFSVPYIKSIVSILKLDSLVDDDPTNYSGDTLSVMRASQKAKSLLNFAHDAEHKHTKATANYERIVELTGELGHVASSDVTYSAAVEDLISDFLSHKLTATDTAIGIKDLKKRVKTSSNSYSSSTSSSSSNSDSSNSSMFGAAVSLSTLDNSGGGGHSTGGSF